MDDLLAALADIGFAMRLVRRLYATKADVEALRYDVQQIRVPELISALENDADYQTGTEVDAKAAAVEAAAQAALDALAESTAEALDAIPRPEPIALTIPTTGWLNTDSGYYRDIDVPGLTAATYPAVSVAETSDDVALDCALLHCCQSRAGKLRVFAADIPAEPIPITLHIIR